MKTIAKTTLCIALLSLLKANAQEIPKVKEYGVGFSGLNAYSLQYRWGNEKRLFRLTGNIGGSTAFGKSDNSSHDISNNTPVSVQTGTSDNKSPVNINCGLNFSILKLKAVNEKFGFFGGGMLGISYSISTTHNISNGTYLNNNGATPVISPTTDDVKNSTQWLSPHIGLALGAYYKINPAFIVYAEIAPNIFYQYSKTRNTRSQTQGPGISNLTDSDQTGYTHSFGLSNLSNSYASITLVYRITK